MIDKASEIERQLFREAFLYFNNHANPPSNHSEEAADWWVEAAKAAGELSQRWEKYPIMSDLLAAVYNYLMFKGDQKTKELDDFE